MNHSELRQIPTETVIVAERYRGSLGDLSSLVQSIHEVGLMSAIVVDENLRLIAGARRLAAWKLAHPGEPIEAKIVNLNSDEFGVLRLVMEEHENTCRLDFLPSEAVAIGRAIEAREAEKAAARVGGRPRKSEPTASMFDDETSGKLPEVLEQPSRAADVAANAVGLSRRTYEKAKAVVDAANDDTLDEPEREIARQALTEMDETGKIDPAYKKIKPHVSHNAGDNEWYTPAEYIEAATAVMGAIDLDPASSATANEVVGAATFYTADDNGLEQPWSGRVWMNPPYSQPLISQFCERLTEAYAEGDVIEAITLTNNATETGWFHRLAEQASAICLPRSRIRFWHPDKTSAPLQGQAIVYLGSNPQRFIERFAEFGIVAEVRHAR